jgi:hypothetical protein
MARKGPTMRSGTVLVLRLVGPLIQVLCLALLFWPGSRGLTVGGLPFENLLYGGFALGFLIAIMGVILSRFEQREPRR